MACTNNKCSDPCQECGAHETCSVKNHIASCTTTTTTSCTTNPDTCPDNMVCTNNKCSDPCQECGSLHLLLVHTMLSGHVSGLVVHDVVVVVVQLAMWFF